MSESTKKSLMELIKSLPSFPGVYLMKNGRGGIVYIGKAANLRSRVLSYFSGGDERCQVRFLMRKVVDVEVMVTDTEKEALILEDILIKKHKPRYNINLKDDKTYLSLRVDMGSKFPRVEVVRKRQRSSGKEVLYYGPYSSAHALRETLGLLQKIFPLRTCRDISFRNRARPCLSYQINRCLAPCCGFIGSEEYKGIMEDVILFLEGRNRVLIKRIKARMEGASDRLEFEEAGRLRDCLFQMESTLEKQKVYASKGNNADVAGIYREGEEVAVYLMSIRDGKVSGGRSFLFSGQELPGEELLSSFLRRYYGAGSYIPDEVIISLDIQDREVVGEWLSDLKGKRVRLFVPRRGDRFKILRLCIKNAKNSFKLGKGAERDYSSLLAEVKEMFGLMNLPRRIECFDISNIHGTMAVGSMVAFVDGKAENDLYRRFRIKTVKGTDDFAMMREVLLRRLKRNSGNMDLPDLVVVDGGKGQLNIAAALLDELGMTKKIDLLALAKEKAVKDKAGGDKLEDRIYIPGRKNAVGLRINRRILFLFQRIRDEAHRFAVSYHKKLRSREALSSPLDGIEGVGPARKKALIRRFGSLRNIRDASLDEIIKVNGISTEIAEKIKMQLAGSKY